MYDDSQLLGFIAQYLPDNTDELITPVSLRYVLAQLVTAKVNTEVLATFAQLASPRFTGTPQVPTAPAGTDSDQVASTAYVQAALGGLASGKTLQELVLPQAVQGGSWYVTNSGLWEARRAFTASAAPASGANWRLVASFTGQAASLTSVDIMDATEAGRAMLTAPTTAVQRTLVNNPRIAAGQYGNHPAFTTEDGPAGAWAWVIKSILTGAAQSVSLRPNAPTEGQVNDQGDTWSFLPPIDYPSFAQLKIDGLPGTTGAEWLNSANCYVQNGRIYVRVVGAVAAGGLAVYVGSSGNVPAGRVLTNDKDFTANNVVPTVPGALKLDFKVDNTSLSPGDTLHFTGVASGGTAPYQHSVQAFNPDSGAVIPLGTAGTASYSDAWPNVPTGVYLGTDAVADAAGTKLVSDARRVVVAQPGSGGGGVTLYPATTTRLGGIKVGAGLTVQPDGTLAAATVDLSPYASKQDLANLIGAAPAALDTLAEIAQQLKADEQGTAAILATQQQHTQQLGTTTAADPAAPLSALATKAGLGADGRLLPGQAPGTGFGIYYDPDKNQYAISDGALALNNANANTKVDPATGRTSTVFGWTTFIIKAVQGITYRSAYLNLLYACYQNVGGIYINAWRTDAGTGTPTASYVSTAPIRGLPNDPVNLLVSVANADIALLHIAPNNIYDDVALKNRLTALEALGGRLRGPWAASTAYKQFDMVVQAGAVYYANAAFTSASSFDAANWTAFPGGGGGTGAGGVAIGSGTVLTFTQDTDYPPIFSGTFTVDVTGAKVGVVVKAELGAGATQPVLDPNAFDFVGGLYQAGKRLGYGFAVAASGKIEYFIYPKP